MPASGELLRAPIWNMQTESEENAADLPPSYAQAPPSKRGAEDVEGHDERAQDRAGKKHGHSIFGDGNSQRL